MATFKYKKLKNNGEYDILETPIISNTYTEYVIADALSSDPNLQLTPSTTTTSVGPGAFERITASIKFINNDNALNTYTPSLSDQTYVLSNRYGENGFPRQFTISAIPTINVSYTPSTSKTEDTFTTNTGFPSKVTVNAIPSNFQDTSTATQNPDAETIPSGYKLYKQSGYVNGSMQLYTKSSPTTTKLTTQGATRLIEKGYHDGKETISVQLTPATPPTDKISSPADSVSVAAGYYSNNFSITSDVQDNGTINEQLQLTPSNYNSTYYDTGYYTGGSENNNGKINIATGSITLSANKDSYTYADWGDYFPTSIKVVVPSDLPTPTSPPVDKTITTQGGSIPISAGYYTEGFSITASLTANTTSGSQYLKPKTKTSYPISPGYYSNNFTIYPSTQELVSTNPSLTYNSTSQYYEKTYEPTTTSGATWGDKYLTKFTLQFTNQSPSSSQTLKPSKTSYPIPTGYHASSRTVSVNTSPLTINNPALTLNNGTASVTISPSASGTWVNTYYPSSITVSFTGVDTNNIVSGTSVCGISGSHTCSGIDTTISSMAASESTILDGYKAYVNGSPVEGEVTTNTGIHFIIEPSDSLSYNSSNQAYEKALLEIDNKYHALKNSYVGVKIGSKNNITSNGTYYATNDGYFYSSVTVEVPDDITHGSIANTSLYYTLTLDNVLTFSGTGDIPDDFISNYLSSYTSYIHNIDMSFAFISSIGDYAFNGCSYVRFLSFSPFTKTIGICAFQNINSALRAFNTALRLVVMPVSLIDMDAYIFYGCWIRNLWFPGRPLTSWPQYGLKVGNDGKIYDLRYAWSSSQHSNDMGADPVYSPKFDANFGNITSLT